LPHAPIYNPSLSVEYTLQIIAALVSLGGVWIAYMAFIRHRRAIARMVDTSAGRLLHRFWFTGWGFDWLDNELIVQPFVWLARKDKNDFIDVIFDGIALLNARLNQLLALTQTGKVRNYLVGMVIGIIITIALVVML
jgi:NADH-quinone oxidoreductase subunit L